MGRRNRLLCEAIVKAIITEPVLDSPQKRSIFSRILAFFHVLVIQLERYSPGLFLNLRSEVWEIDEKDYRDSFHEVDRDMSLAPAGDLGFSGSSFFSTHDGKYLIKSLPRRSEYHFFSHEMLHKYCQHMKQHRNSLLVRITDFLHSPVRTFGTVLRITPAHHIVMENILHGKDDDEHGHRWETYDLKPSTYFYPERDLAGGHLVSDSVKDRLLDTFEDKIRVSRHDGQELIDQLTTDSQLLMDCNVVDYSLFIIRYPQENIPNVALLESTLSAWRSGVASTDGKWIYRAILLDYFWAKHKLQAQLMTGLIKTFNLIGRKGHMSITTTADEYRQRFLHMVEALFERPEV